MKTLSIKEHIINYKKNKSYFHINDLIENLKKKNIDFKRDTIKRYLHTFKKEGLIYSAGKGWYSTLEEKFSLNTKPIEKIVNLLNNKFPFLNFSSWSTEQIKGYFHHLPATFLTFIYADKDLLQSIKDFLSENGFNVYLNPHKDEVKKYLEFTSNTIILRHFFSPRASSNKYFANIEKILIDLYIEARKINLIELEEYKNIVSNVILNYLINMSRMLDYAERREKRREVENIINKII